MKILFAIIISSIVFLHTSIASAQRSPAVFIKVDVIYASNERAFIDKKISRIVNDLKNLFAYSNYELIDIHSLETKYHQTGQIPLPNASRLQIVPLAEQAGYILLNVLVNRSNGYIMNTNFRIINGGTILVGGPRYKKGVLVFAITVETMR